MKIALVVGHDAIKQGAYGNEGVSEFDFNDGLMNDMAFKGLLPDNHVVYVLYRDTDIKGYTAQMKDLHQRIDALECEVSIELHFNGSDNPNVNGFEVLYCSHGGKAVANKLIDAFANNLPTNNRGAKKITKGDRGYGFVSNGKSYAIISEAFFSLHQSDYVHGGKYRTQLMTGFTEFLESL